ncbi:MAG TPA: M1 family aminopeptidase [Bryobacteraceae bacterium]
MLHTRTISGLAAVPLICARLASAQANADPNYRALRDAAPQETYRVQNIELKRDVGTLTLRSGQITFLAPALNRVSMAVFNGEGRFQLKPAFSLEERYLNKLTGKSEADEPIDSALLAFTDNTFEEIGGQARTMPLDARAADILRDFRRLLRHPSETPHAQTEALFSEWAPNLEAELLAELYNPAQRGSFRAFLHGKQDANLRFLVVPGGALPRMPSPEEVALVNIDPSGERDGIWHLTHRESEWKGGTASSVEDHNLVAPEHYRIEAKIESSASLAASAAIRFKAKIDGARVIPFDLVSALRVSRVTDEGGRALPFIQEPWKEDAAFYVILPEPTVRGRSYEIHVDYGGAKVIHQEGQGNFSVEARESWYPSMNSFADQATYDLTFKVPKQYTLVSVGKLMKEWTEENLACTEWISEVPLAVAGFNYGAFRKKQVTDAATKYNLEAYYTADVPDYLRGLPDMNLTPSSMAERVLQDAQNSIRLYQHWFGDAPYGRIAITQQPEFDFGQSWPTLVYLPISAFLDSTQRWRLLEDQAFRFGDFIQEVTPHEVSHQWWGHMVGWATYHDQWLSEGFADFSAGLFLEATEKPAESAKFWDRLRDAIVQKNSFGNSANDAGPLWLGFRLNSQKTAGAYNRLVYSKGAYFLQMLRMLMRDEKTGDQDFIAMMHDYVQAYLHRAPSTEDFKNLVEKHMKPAMDAEGNHRMDWFFRDWIYGSEIPKYRFEYTLTPAEGGKVVLEGKLLQSDVSPGFLMMIPLYLDFDGHWVRAGTVRVQGSSANIKATLPKTPKRIALNVNHDVLAADVVVKKQ